MSVNSVIIVNGFPLKNKTIWYSAKAFFESCQRNLNRQGNLRPKPIPPRGHKILCSSNKNWGIAENFGENLLLIYFELAALWWQELGLLRNARAAHLAGVEENNFSRCLSRIQNCTNLKEKAHKQIPSPHLFILIARIETWKFEREEKEKSLAIEDFLEQHDSEDTADTPGWPWSKCCKGWWRWLNWQTFFMMFL